MRDEAEAAVAAAAAEEAFPSNEDDGDDASIPNPGSKESLPSSSETKIPISPILLEPPASISAIFTSAAARKSARLPSVADNTLSTPRASRSSASTGSAFPPLKFETASAARDSHGRAFSDQEVRVTLMSAPAAASRAETALPEAALRAARSSASAERRGPGGITLLLLLLLLPLSFFFKKRSSMDETAASDASAAAPRASDVSPHASRATASAAATEAESASCLAEEVDEDK